MATAQGPQRGGGPDGRRAGGWRTSRPPGGRRPPHAEETSRDPGEAALWQFDTAHRLLVSAAVK